MRRIVFGLLLVPLIACSDVLADDAQVPNAMVPNANTGGSQQVQANRKLPSDQVSPPSQIDRSKNRKQASMTRSRGPSAPGRYRFQAPRPMLPSIPLTWRSHLFPNRRRLPVTHGPAFTSALALALLSLRN